MDITKNYYEILGLENSCTQSEVKKAYRKLSITAHPEKGGDETIFASIVEAYEVLFDIKQRQSYDKLSEFGANYEPEAAYFLNYDFAKHRKIVKDKSKELDIIVLEYKLSEIPDTIHLSYSRNMLCNTCNGSGKDSDKEIDCFVCKGEGEIFSKPTHIKDPDYPKSIMTCYTCLGSGKFKPECDFCEGTGRDDVYDTECVYCKGSGYSLDDSCQCCQGKGLKVDNVEVTLQIIHSEVIEHNGSKFFKIANRGNYSLTKKRYMDLILKFD